MNPLYALIARRASHRCEYCRAPEQVFNFSFEVEHVTPVRDGGTDASDNLALACRSCNAHKAGRRVGFDTPSGESVRLFDPRRDAWDEHFRVDLDRAEVVGLTPTGRVTVELLGMNSPQHVLARAQWIEYRCFP